MQKAPKLLDVVQRLIDKRRFKFILTGSSARKLKRGGANLLAGRAYTYNLYPLTHLELGDRFELNQNLAFGGSNQRQKRTFIFAVTLLHISKKRSLKSRPYVD